MKIRECDSILSATLTEGFRAQRLEIVDEEPWGGLWLAGNEFGATYLIRADSFQSAWDAMLDAMPTIPEEELLEAYGLETAEELDALEYGELVQGYEYQPNAGGTGIVDVGHYTWLREADESDRLCLTIEPQLCCGVGEPVAVWSRLD